MADFWDSNDDDDETENGQGDGPGDLRKAHRAASRKVKELEAKLAERDEALKGLNDRVRGREVADLLQAKGVSPKVAKYVLRDVEDPTEDSVSSWLKENADVFNIKATDSADTDSPDSASQEPLDEETDVPTPGAEDLAALYSALQAGGSPGSVINTGAASALLRDVEGNAKSLEDVIALMGKHGIEVQSGY